MAERKIKTKNAEVRALISPESFDAQKGTVQVVFATEAPYLRDGWRIGIDTPYFEVLSCQTQNVRMDRANQGLPLFDNHPFEKSAVAQLGKVTDIKCLNGQLTGTLNFGARMDDAMKSDIQTGIITSLSVGYQVNSLQLDESKAGEYPTYTVTDWEPFEVSFAPVPADPAAQVRSTSAENEVITIITDNFKIKSMKIKEIKEKGTTEQKDRLAQIKYVTRNAKLTDDKIEDYFNGEKTVEVIESECRSQEDANAKTIETKIEEAKKNASKAEKDRIDNIMTAARNGGVDVSKVFDWYKDGKPDEEIYRSICNEFSKKDPHLDGSHGHGEDERDKMKRGMEETLLHRCCPSQFKDNPQNEFRSYSIIEMAKKMARARGVNMDNMSRSQIADMILKRDLSTSDFPLLLEGLSNKMLLQDYPGTPEYWTKISKEVPFTDFKDKNFYRATGQTGMHEVAEGEEVEYGSLSESKQKTRIKPYAQGLKLTRQAIINDDLSVFAQIPEIFIRDWNLLQGDVVWEVVNAGKLADGSVAFTTKHGNTPTAGSIISDDTLSDARAMMKKQTNDAGKAIRVIPHYLIVSPDQETIAQKMLTGIMANTVGGVNIWSGAFELISECRLMGKKWWLAADPNSSSVQGLVHGYLDGSGLRSYRDDNFKADSIDFIVRGEFAAAMIDYRGWYMNPGE